MTVRQVGAWLYNWVTVIAGLAVGALSYGLDLFDYVTGSTDLTPLLPPDKALKIVTCVALVKGAHAFWKSQRGQQ